MGGVPTALDQFRGTPYLQTDMRVSRPVKFGERWTVSPFVELFNLFDRNNPGANYVTNIASLPVPAAQAAAGSITDICADADCTTTAAITSPSQLRVAEARWETSSDPAQPWASHLPPNSGPD
jgi:hypothetical protein